MKISGPFFDPARKGAKKPWFLDYFAPVLDDEGRPVVVGGKVQRKRRRPRYESKALAMADKESLQEQYATAGAGSFMHSRESLADFEAARRILPAGVSLLTAARHWLKHNPAIVPATIEAKQAEFLAHLELLHGKDRHYSDLKSRTGDLVRAFAGRDPNTVTRKEAMDYLLNLPHKPRGKLNHKRAACNFFNWMLTADRCVEQNPFGGIKRRQLPKVLPKEIEFLPIERVERYLRAAERYDPELVAHEVVQLFAGVRADDEMATFRGEWVKAATRQVVTPAEMTKSGRRDVITGLEENFWLWWQAYGREGRLRPANYEPRWLRLRALAAVDDAAARDELARQPIKTLLAAQKPPAWPWNARRRTFCSYKVAKDESAAKAANILRHKGGEAVLRNSYLGLGLTKAEGTAYFALAPRPVARPIRPEVVARGIVKLQQDPAWRANRKPAGRLPPNAETA